MVQYTQFEIEKKMIAKNAFLFVDAILLVSLSGF